MKKKQWGCRKLFCINHPSEIGISLPELTATLAVTGILAAVIMPSISFGRDALTDSGHRIESMIKLARSRSMSQTSAYRISPQSNNKLKVEFSNRCNSSTWTNARGFLDTDLNLDENVAFSSAAEDGVVVTDPGNDWSVCFNSQGFADKTLNLTLFNSKKNKTQQIQIFRGGTVTVL